MTVVIDPTKPAAGTTPPTTTAETGQPLTIDAESSKQLAQAGIVVENWQARYDGLVGSTRQLVEKFNGQIGAKDAEITRLNQAISDLNALKDKADSADALTTQLATATAEAATAAKKLQKQEVLMKHSSLLAKTKEGAQNPLIDIFMAADLPAEQLEAKAAELEALNWGAATVPPVGGGTPPPPPASQGQDTPDAWREKALEAHTKFITSGRKDKQAQADEEAAWAKHRELTTK